MHKCKLCSSKRRKQIQGYIQENKDPLNCRKQCNHSQREQFTFPKWAPHKTCRALLRHRRQSSTTSPWHQSAERADRACKGQSWLPRGQHRTARLWLHYSMGPWLVKHKPSMGRAQAGHIPTWALQQSPDRKFHLSFLSGQLTAGSDSFNPKYTPGWRSRRVVPLMA